MADEFVIDKSQPDQKLYLELTSIIRNVLNKNDNLITNLSNFTAVLKQTFDKISWVGFYLFDNEKLYLGPFQGKVACTQIELGKGVCGTSALKKKTIIVNDVNEFPGHIVCDSDSKSEIVIPLLKNNKLLGVLDIDSPFLSAFDETDKQNLEYICNFLTEEIF
ncbi:MAG: GAF domain-containing protein [Ignavibacteriaceae bacterium]|nr:GAF domain-containing protein [Ignavibacteriaceae bacterium]